MLKTFIPAIVLGGEKIRPPSPKVGIYHIMVQPLTPNHMACSCLFSSGFRAKEGQGVDTKIAQKQFALPKVPQSVQQRKGQNAALFERKPWPREKLLNRTTNSNAFVNASVLPRKACDRNSTTSSSGFRLLHKTCVLV